MTDTGRRARQPPGRPSGRPVPRLARHPFTLTTATGSASTVSGRGVPLVVVHGFTAEGFLYAQTLSRLVATGFKVVAIDMAGHGGTQGLPLSGGHLGDYAALMGRVVEELGIRKAVFAGHSMGGRVVAQLAAQRPEQTIAVLLIDAIVGDQWDRMVNLFRLQPVPVGADGRGAACSTRCRPCRWCAIPRQAARLGRLLAPMMVGHATHPWRLVGPAASILRTRGSRGILDELALDEVPTFVLHGDRDLIVPIATARSAAKRSNGQLITVEGRGPLVDAARSRDAAGHRGRAAAGPAGRGHPRGHRRGRAPTRPTSSSRSSTSPTPPSCALDPAPTRPAPAAAAPPAAVPLDHHLSGF